MPPRVVQSCRWSECTLFLPKPYWLDAWDFPSSCRKHGETRPLGDTRRCLDCPDWAPAAVEPQAIEARQRS